MSSWQTAPLITADFPHWATPGNLDVATNGGTVTLSRRNSSDAWEVFETFDTDGAYKLEVANTPAMQISVTGSAEFRWTWSS